MYTIAPKQPVAAPDIQTRRVASVRIEMVRERSIVYPGNGIVSSPGDLAAVARAFIGNADREMFVAVFLDSKHRITALQATATGTLNATLVHPRELFKGCLLANAAAVGLAHNHPSGDPTPSPEDLALTETLLEAGVILGIRVLDHCVIGDDRHVSLRETTRLWASHPFHR
jgi:DNA repair protein RadC